MSADSAMKCTPQKTMYGASGRAAASLGELERVAGDVGELDDLVALVVVAEHEHPVAERRLGRAGALDQAGVGRRGQVAGALDAALAVRGPRLVAAEQQQGQRASAGTSSGDGRAVAPFLVGEVPARSV